MLVERLSNEKLSVEEMMEIMKDSFAEKNINISCTNIDFNELNYHVAENNVLAKVNYWQEIMPKKNIIAPVIIIVSKIFRRIFKWFLLPIVESQNKSNISFCKAINKLTESIKVLNDNYMRYQQHLNTIEKEIADIKGRITEMEEDKTNRN